MTVAIKTLFSASKHCLTFIHDDICAGLSMIEYLWQDEGTAKVINSSKTLLNESLGIDCRGVCKGCRHVVFELFERLRMFGLENILFNFIEERQRLKREKKCSNLELKET